MPILTIPKYALHRGISRDAVVWKIRRGIISEKSLVHVEGYKFPRIDSDRADLELEFNGDEDRKEAYENLHPQAEAKAAKLAPAPPEEPEEPGEPAEESGEESSPTQIINGVPYSNPYRDAKISSELLKAKKLELEIAQREGRLLDADSVRKRITQLVTETKDAILNVPGRIAPTLVSITDPVEMETRLLQELNAALSNLSRLSV